MAPMIIFSILAIIPVLSISRKHLKPRIVNGIPTLASEYPFIVDVRMHYPVWDIVEESFCTASLLRLEKPATILTAAHCLEDVVNQSLAVYLLRSDADDNKSATNNFTFHPAHSFIIHPDYNKTSIDNDVALIFLNEDISNNKRLSTVQLPSFDYNSAECCTDNESLRVMGYGADYSDGPPTDTLEYTNKKFISRDECSKRILDYLSWKAINCNYTSSAENATFSCHGRSYSFDGDYSNIYNWSSDLTKNMICAIGDNTDSCQGDSGGPLIKTGTNIQVGVVSYGYECNEGVPGVYANLGIYNDWINEQIQNTVAAIVSFSTTERSTTKGDGDGQKTTLDENAANSYHISMIVIGMLVNFF